MLETIPRLLGSLVDPRRGLWLTWLIVLVMSSAVDRHLAGLVFLSTYFILLLLMLIVHAIIPPPPRLSDRSALIARVSLLAKAVWAAAIFAAAAAYGALAGIAIEQFMKSEPPGDVVPALLDNLFWPLVGLVTLFAAWVTGMFCAYDLTRTGADARNRRIARLRHSLAPRSAFSLWLSQLATVVTGKAWPWCIAYAAPIIIVSAWASLSGGPAGLRLF